MKVKEIHEIKNFDIEACNIIYKLIVTRLNLSKKKLNIALSGGTTPLKILSLLKQKKIEWSRINFFLVDERIVDVNSNDSNFNNLNEVFFNFISAESFPIVTEKKYIDNDILEYEKIIREKVNWADGKPRFDLIFLGMGLDGHTASLFHNSISLIDEKKFFKKNKICGIKNERVTMTYSVLLNADQIVLIIKGLKKKRLLFNKERVNDLPIDLILNYSKNIQILCSKG